MSEDVKISVVTVNYNNGKTLERAIRSILSQPKNKDEYIVVDNLSTDESKEILLKYRSEIDHLIIEADTGISDAYNKGVNRASGEYILMLAADDWLESGSLSKWHSILAEIPGADIYAGGVNLWEKNKFLTRAFSTPSKIKIESSIQHAGSLIKRSLILELNGFNLEYKYAMDYEFFLRAHLEGFSIKSIPIVFSNKGLSGVSQKMHKQALQETYHAREVHLDVKNLKIWYYYAWCKDSIGRLLKKYWVSRFLYRWYWTINNHWIATKSKYSNLHDF